MPHTPNAPSSSIQSRLSEMQDITDDAKKNKVQLTPEIQAYIREHLEAVQWKLAKREDITEDDLEFIKIVRMWVKLLSTMEPRFAKQPEHYKRPEGIDFAEVKNALWKNPALIHSLTRMEETGGEPDIIAVEKDAFVFGDCSAESPIGRRNLDFDQSAQMAKEFGVDMMSEEAYREMQKTGNFDFNSWSWLKTDDDTRKTGSALNGGRYDGDVSVLVYNARDHYPNGGWRGVLRVQKT